MPGADPKVRRAKRAHFQRMNIFKNWPRIYTRATRAFRTYEDTEQYNWAFDSLLSDEKKELIARSRKKNYVERRANKQRQEPCDRNIESNKNVHGFYGTTIKEYDLLQFL